MGTNDDELSRDIEEAEKRADEARNRPARRQAEAEHAPAEDDGVFAPEQDEEQPTPALTASSAKLTNRAAA